MRAIYTKTHSTRPVYISFRNALPKIPFPLRRFLCAHAHWMPLIVVRKLLALATHPLPADKKWIHPIVSQETWKGIWVNPLIKNAKQAEETALDQDLIILYIHGKASLKEECVHMCNLNTHWPLE